MTAPAVDTADVPVLQPKMQRRMRVTLAASVLLIPLAIWKGGSLGQSVVGGVLVILALWSLSARQADSG